MRSCPVCRLFLETSGAPDSSVLRCASCGGLWIAGPVTLPLPDQQRALIDEALQAPAPATASMAFAGLTRTCPTCMTTSLVPDEEGALPGVAYRCPKCAGIWIELPVIQPAPVPSVSVERVPAPPPPIPDVPPALAVSIPPPAEPPLPLDAGPLAGTDAGAMTEDMVEPPVLGAEDALQRLLEGNDRFTAERARRPNCRIERVAAVATAQTPFAVIVGCSDSRVPPEVIFDRGIGDLFVVRTAGHVVTSTALGSVLYAVDHLAVPLVVVLGHTGCGAVRAAMDAREAPAYLDTVVRSILPAVEISAPMPGSHWDNAVRVNTTRTAERIRTAIATHVPSQRVARVRVVSAIYDTGTGTVTVLQASEISQETDDTGKPEPTATVQTAHSISATDDKESPGAAQRTTIPEPASAGEPPATLAATASATPERSVSTQFTRWCPKCRAGYDDQTTFCTVCGVLLVQPTYVVPCLQCGKPNLIGTDRCYACGADLHPTARASRRRPPPLVLSRRTDRPANAGCGTTAGALAAIAAMLVVLVEAGLDLVGR